VVALSPLKHFALGLNAERTLVDGAHRAHRQCRADAAPGGRPGPEPGAARRRTRWCTRCASRDLAGRRCAAWNGRAPRPLEHDRHHRFPGAQLHLALPGAASARGLGLAALQAVPGARDWLARRMMFGIR
jgi:2-octaprenyl-6-methoxyphenol hydroxylase